jgi:hypothetical protein
VSVVDTYTRLDGRNAVVAAAGGHPYARYGALGEVTGYRSGAALVRRSRGRRADRHGSRPQPRRRRVHRRGGRASGVPPARTRFAAVTAVLTTVLLDEFAAVGLGVMADADATRRIYERLGYGEHLLRTSLHMNS